ncbi:MULTISPECIES: hypothetical protein [Myroides]|uniref:TIGR02646 family protein n=1 Tax=Myroides odoratimimus TaxID=76832 RepID=A0AAI8C5W6_9FLAO|nr:MULTISPECIES: hypothetical protein [Myroides]ALU26729.1 hypothetical protein AS202_11475 [Myroides odoratimimus]APA92748.1 hypothetical protein BK054_11080 [Myroides sp. ZB35]MDM1035096.1 hypothetical protein [Myroides odoratimimus]MDM1037792.1 hypothetical protein [Myroides odoratimimus]MDM1052075.1 hypothetical protein [Myroides odoratimimus]
MRYIDRLDKPQKLVDNEEKWLAKYLEKRALSDKVTPHTSQYGHKEVKETLARSSFYKCFYSEVKFADLSEAQVDHYVEVSEDPTKAFEWENLYLSHKDSNVGKITNRALPNQDCLDPCTAIDAEIEEHLGFEDEVVIGLTERGRKTIQKYHLNKPLYSKLRSTELRKLDKIIRQRALSELPFDEKFKAKLRIFANPDQAFSLMFKKLLIENGLL